MGPRTEGPFPRGFRPPGSPWGWLRARTPTCFFPQPVRFLDPLNGDLLGDRRVIRTATLLTETQTFSLAVYSNAVERLIYLMGVGCR